MATIILVMGVGNSGKTSSIRLFLENNGVFFKKEKGDIALTLRIQKNTRSILLGITSGGDTEEIVKENFDFLKNKKCDYIICASKSNGKTVKYIDGMLHESYGIIKISTNKASKEDKAQHEIENSKIAKAIDSHIK